jgi:nucleoside 2-deoxyribosyltransferase
MRKSIYLAGPITGLTFDDADEWRIQARTYLASKDIDGLSPLRGKSYLKNLGELTAVCLQEGQAGLLSLPRSIMTRDFYDATTCDVLLVNLLGATRVSIGTMMEVAWAYQKRTPIVCCMEMGNVHEHAMLNEAIGFRVNTLEEGLAVCVAILNPNVGADASISK